MVEDKCKLPKTDWSVDPFFDDFAVWNFGLCQLVLLWMETVTAHDHSSQMAPLLLKIPSCQKKLFPSLLRSPQHDAPNCTGTTSQYRWVHKQLGQAGILVNFDRFVWDPGTQLWFLIWFDLIWNGLLKNKDHRSRRLNCSLITKR